MGTGSIISLVAAYLIAYFREEPRVVELVTKCHRLTALFVSNQTAKKRRRSKGDYIWRSRENP